jgi:hypothetical protein
VQSSAAVCSSQRRPRLVLQEPARRTSLATFFHLIVHSVYLGVFERVGAFTRRNSRIPGLKRKPLEMNPPFSAVPASRAVMATFLAVRLARHTRRGPATPPRATATVAHVAIVLVISLGEDINELAKIKSPRQVRKTNATKSRSMAEVFSALLQISLHATYIMYSPASCRLQPVCWTNRM